MRARSLLVLIAVVAGASFVACVDGATPNCEGANKALCGPPAASGTPGGDAGADGAVLDAGGDAPASGDAGGDADGAPPADAGAG